MKKKKQVGKKFNPNSIDMDKFTEDYYNSSPIKKAGSYVDEKTGEAYFKHTGRYNEVTKDAIGKIKS